MQVILTIIATIIIFLLLIFVHEFGHFAVAKACHARVDEFSLGMGPCLWQKQHGETMYSLRLLPIGGYCALGGEDEETGLEGDFVTKPWWQKICILVAGAFMNFVLAILLMSLIAFISGTASNTLATVTDGSPAQEAGLIAGDRIVAIDGYEISDWSDIIVALSENAKADTPVSVTAVRDGNTTEYSIVPYLDEDTQRYMIGITPDVEHRPIYSIYIGAKSTRNLAKIMLTSLGQLFTGRAGADEISGPVGIVQVISQSVSYGIVYVAYVAAIISLNLGIINLLPIPALDGGRVVFVIIRKITGKAITDEMEGKVHFVGMALLLLLLVFVTFNDVGRIVG